MLRFVLIATILLPSLSLAEDLWRCGSVYKTSPAAGENCEPVKSAVKCSSSGRQITPLRAGESAAEVQDCSGFAPVKAVKAAPKDLWDRVMGKGKVNHNLLDKKAKQEAEEEKELEAKAEKAEKKRKIEAALNEPINMGAGASANKAIESGSMDEAKDRGLSQHDKDKVEKMMKIFGGAGNNPGLE